MAARRLAELVSKKGNVAMMRYQEGSASTMEREKGFMETLAREFPNVKVVSHNQYGGATTETAYKTAENLLIKLPDLAGVFCPNESTTFACWRAGGRERTARSASSLRREHEARIRPQRARSRARRAEPLRDGERGVAAVVAHLTGKRRAAHRHGRRSGHSREPEAPEVAPLLALISAVAGMPPRAPLAGHRPIAFGRCGPARRARFASLASLLHELCPKRQGSAILHALTNDHGISNRYSIVCCSVEGRERRLKGILDELRGA